MAKRKQQPSWLVWLNRHWQILGWVGILLLAAAFRAAGLTNLPPGLSGGEALIGSSALALLHHGTLPGLTAATGFAPLWVVLQAAMVALFGHTAVALRLWPVLLGVLAVPAVWLWAKDWFSPRIAWIAAILMAVTPWAVTMSRSASPAIMAVVLMPLLLWAGGRLATRYGGARYAWILAGLFTISLFCGLTGIAAAAATLILALVPGYKAWARFSVKRSALPAAIAAAGVVLIAASTWISHVGHNLAATINFSPAGMLGVAGMFNLHGDDNFLHNFGGEPMLNAFVGLMFITGLLVAGIRSHLRRYLAVLVALVIALLPALLTATATPNAFRAAAALPVVLVIAAIGTSYMLELWYSTFPINSAARSTGLAAIILLLGLSVLQGYVQVFRAWSGSIQTYQAYNEAAVGVAGYINTAKPAPTRYVVASPDEQAVVGYLEYGKPYHAIAPADIATIPVGSGLEQFLITSDVRDATAKQLALKYSGGKLAPHTSSFSGNELFYNYEITK